MKFILLLTTFFIASMHTNGQQLTVKLTSQGWAGGICCATGNNYTVTITGTKKDLQGISIESICVDGHFFNAGEISLNTNAGSDTSITWSFRFAQNDRYDTYPGDKNTKPSCTDNGVKLKSKELLPFTGRIELPYIAYP